MLFLKAMKLLTIGIIFIPITGCAVAAGLIFAALVSASGRNPEAATKLFGYATLGFAFVESFSFILVLIAALVLLF